MRKFWLIVVLVVAVFFRFFWLTSSPPALNWDEVSIGYNAYSILKTGRDEWGQFLPLSFKAFGEHKLPGMIYASIPGIWLFGTTDFGVRVTPAFIGVLAVYLIYLLTKKLFSNETQAIAAALLMAISPWAVHFSRVSFEAGLAMVLMMTSVYFLLGANTRPKQLWLSMLFAVLAAYTYNSIRIFLPLMFLGYLYTGAIPWRQLSLRRVVPVVLFAFLLLTPIVIGLTRAEERVRLGTVSILNQKSFVDGIAESRGYTTLPSVLPRLIHNKATHYAHALSTNYLQVFSTEFLFFSGGENTQRSVQGLGLLHYFEFPLLILGLFALFKKNSHPLARSIIIPWLLLSPIPSIITIDSPSTVRALNLLPALLLIESLGVITALGWLRQRRLAQIIVGLFVFWNISYFAYQLFLVYPIKYSDKWLYGYKQAVQFAAQHYDDVDLIYLPAKYGEPHIFTLFYSGFDPALYQSLNVRQEVDPTGWIHVSGFDKYRFSDFSGLEAPEEILARNTGSIVMVTGFAQLPGEYERIFEVKAPNWKVMFEGTIQEGKQ